MSLVATKTYTPFPTANYTSGWIFGTLDADGEMIAMCFAAPKTGTLKGGACCLHSGSAGSTFDLDIRLETLEISGASGYKPTGTLYDVDASGEILSPATSGTIYGALNGGAGVAVTKGDLMALVFKAKNVTGGASRLFLHGYRTGQVSNMPYAAEYLGASWNIETQASPNFVIEYTDGMAFLPGAIPAIKEAGVTVNSGTNPKQVGIRFKTTFPARIMGFCMSPKQGDQQAVLYGSDGVTVLASKTMINIVYAVSGGYSVNQLFDTPVEIAKDTYYRLVIKGVAASTSAVVLTAPTFDNGGVSINPARAGGGDVHKTTCAGEASAEGDWTQTVGTDVSMAVLFDQFDDGEAVCDYPADTDVRSGVSFDSGGETGALDLPAEAVVKEGVDFDQTTKTGTFARQVVGGLTVNGADNHGTMTIQGD